MEIRLYSIHGTCITLTKSSTVTGTKSPPGCSSCHFVSFVPSCRAFVAGRGSVNGNSARDCSTNSSSGSPPRISIVVVHDGLRHAVHLIPPREVGELGRFDRVGRDVGAGERHLVREADRPRTVRSRRGREHAHRDRLVDEGETRTAPRRERRLAPAGQQDRLHQRDELVAARRPEEADARVAELATTEDQAPVASVSGEETAMAGTRSMPYCLALSGSRMKFTSSIVMRSESGGSSSRICFVCRHVSHPSVCVKNNSRTGRVISANASRSRS